MAYITDYDENQHELRQLIRRFIETEIGQLRADQAKQRSGTELGRNCLGRDREKGLAS